MSLTMQKIIESLALQKSQKEEAGAARDSAFNARIESLEQKIQSILQENAKIQVELNEARTLHLTRQLEFKTAKNLLLNEITPLEKTVSELTSSVASMSQTNSELSVYVDQVRAGRDTLRGIWVKGW